MATAPTIQIQPLPNTPSAVDLLDDSKPKLISQPWNQWLLQAQQKINVINETLAIISQIVLTPSGAIPISSGGTGGVTRATAFDNLSPLITDGDVLIYNGGNVRLGAGSLSDVLTINPGTGLPDWLPSSGSSSGGTPIVTGELVDYDDTSSILHVTPQFVYFDDGDLLHL